MENNQTKISVRELTEEVTQLIKDEIVATYTQDDNMLQMRFVNGQKFRIRLEEAL